MLDTLSKGFRNARLKLQGKAEITEDVISDALRDVRVSLIEADVDLDVIRGFLDKVKSRALGTIVPLKGPRGVPVQVTPADHFIKSCYDELEALMGPGEAPLALEGKPAVIMMVGLQGSGKTTTAGKLARVLMRQGKKPMLVAADIYRPAAIEQLTTLGRKLNVPVFTIKGMDPVQLASLAVTQARNVGRDVVIIDTAGRLAIDETLMVELEQIKRKTDPRDILFVCDAMIGQDAVRTAAEFNRRLEFTGFVLTKMDGDARGGAALSIKAVTGKPVQFVGMGEGLDKLEAFRPAGIASRILGFGDVVGLMNEFEQHVDKATAETQAMEMLRGEFTFDHFKDQLRLIKQMGSLRDVMSKLPFMDEMMGQVPKEALDDSQLVRVEAMIDSMTKQERRKPELLDDSRIKRIASGSGRPIDEVKALREQFFMTRNMMKDMGVLSGVAGTARDQRKMQEQLQRLARGAAGAGAAGGMAGLERGDRDARRRKAREERKGRKKGR